MSPRTEHTTDTPTTNIGQSASPVESTSEALSIWGAVVLAVSWVGGLWWALGVQPASDPDAPISLIAVLLSLTLWSLVAATLIGAARRERWALRTSLVGALALLGTVGLCITEGHTGAWVFTQGAIGVGLLGSTRLSSVV